MQIRDAHNLSMHKADFFKFEISHFFCLFNITTTWQSISIKNFVHWGDLQSRRAISDLFSFWCTLYDIVLRKHQAQRLNKIAWLPTLINSHLRLTWLKSSITLLKYKPSIILLEYKSSIRLPKYKSGITMDSWRTG